MSDFLTMDTCVDPPKSASSYVLEDSFLSSFVTSKSNGNLEKIFRLPDFHHAYTKHPRRTLTSEYTEEAHKFLASHGVDKQLGSRLWSAYVSGKTPELMGLVFVRTEPQDFFWLCKFVALIFALNTKMDESEYSDNPDKSCATILGMTLALLWCNPDEERLLENVKPLYECITADESRHLVEAFHEDLAHAKNKTKSILDINMTPIASAFRELWMEYCEVVPAELVSREANTLQDFLMGCVWESNNRKIGYEIRNVDDYVVIRRLSSTVLPFIICTDMLITRSFKVPQIPNSLFYGPEMQTLLLAINDIIAWHNDIFSFQKEIVMAEGGHNLVKLVCKEYKCASYTEAGEIALQLIYDRIADMEHAYLQLKGVASPEYHPAIDCYIATCRDAISGSHQWHFISKRYNIAGDVIM